MGNNVKTTRKESYHRNTSHNSRASDLSGSQSLARENQRWRIRAQEFNTGGTRRENEAPVPLSIRVAIKTEEAFDHEEDNVGDERVSAKQAAVLPECAPSSAFVRSAEIKREDRRED